YSDYFLDPFLSALEGIGVKPRIIDNYLSYKEGKYTDYIKIACDKRKEIKQIIEEISGRELTDEWYPYNPIGSDGSMEGVKVTNYEWPYIEWVDNKGVKGKSDLRKGEGKLPWRIDWAARWKIHGVTCEPAGKDHGAAGGSYDTGIPICELLGGKPPEKMVYEWIQMKGKGPMSSSSGLTIGPIEALEIIPPEIMRYTIARSKINRHIDFDTGETLIKIVDEYERIRDSISSDHETSRMKKNRDTSDGALRLSQIVPDIMPESSKIPFNHLSLLAQIKSDDRDIWSSLKNSGHLNDEPSEWLKDRLWRMKNWINGPHFPEKFKITVNEVISDEVLENFNSNQKEYLITLGRKLESCEWNNVDIVNVIKESLNESGINGKEGFTSIYLAILGKESGPRAASLILELGREHVCDLLSTMN
ncbi:MAG: lysine--tRNA ligase, partial [Euryarchaeota archaeon]|nr:lysine--tRNA ligase [Euryarchaeota archaeon]